MTNKEAIKYLIPPTATSTNPSESYLIQKEAYELAIKALKERPQGEWVEEIVPVGLVGRGNGQYRCSNCQHGDVHAKTQEVPFCWYCGAKMDKKEANNEHGM